MKPWPRIVLRASVVSATLSFCCYQAVGQFLKIPAPVKAPSAQNTSASQPGFDDRVLGSASSYDFGTLQQGTVTFLAIDAPLDNTEYIAGIEISNNTTGDYHGEFNCGGRDGNGNVTCQIVVGFSPSKAGQLTGTLTVHHVQGTTGHTWDETLSLSGTGANNSGCPQPTVHHGFFPLSGLSDIAIRPLGVKRLLDIEPLATRVYNDFDMKEQIINCYYSTDATFAVFSQIQSIYNGASGSTTVAADIASLNFNNAMQATVGTNIQVGTGGATSPSVANGLPVLSSNQAAQAAQNMFFGGNVYLSGVLLPFFFHNDVNGRWVLMDQISAREGVDLQNFNGQSTSVTAPPSHFNFLDEASWTYQAIPAKLIGGSSPGSILLGARYGYSYTSHGYSADYGWGTKVHSDVGQVQAGILINGSVRIAVSRAFGPTQRYQDSTTNLPVKVNNFKTYSFAIAYESKK